MMKVGDVFYADYSNPQGFCDEAWKAIFQYVFAFAHGADKSLFMTTAWLDGARGFGVRILVKTKGKLKASRK